MQLSSEDAQLFYKLHRALLLFVNQELKRFKPPKPRGEETPEFPPGERLELRDALLVRMDLIDAFADENPCRFSGEELAIVRSWNDLVAGEFYLLRHLKKHTIFLATEPPTVAYEVLALIDPFEALLGTDPAIAFRCDAVLLPFRGRIIYDGILPIESIPFQGKLKQALNAGYRQAKEEFGVVASLPGPAGTRPASHPKPSRSRPAKGGKKATGRSARPDAILKARDRIAELTDVFCREHLDDEYAALCRKLADVLAGLRDSPIARGKPESWACGIVRAIGFVNFLGDPSQPHSMKMTDIDEGFGVSEATGSAKSMAIRENLDMIRFDPEWTVPSKIDDNPLFWILTVNGLPMDIRSSPREAQVAAFEKGLIPYIPADRPRKPGTR